MYLSLDSEYLPSSPSPPGHAECQRGRVLGLPQGLELGSVCSMLAGCFSDVPVEGVGASCLPPRPASAAPPLLPEMWKKGRTTYNKPLYNTVYLKEWMRIRAK